MTNRATNVTLKQKGDEAFLPIRQLFVKLQWRAAVDLDLMAFYKAKDGRTGGIYSDNYEGGTLGDLNSFPFMQLSGDAGVGDTAGDNEEVLRITQLDDMETVYVCAVNFSDATGGSNASFGSYDGRVEILDDRGESLCVPLDAQEEGTVAVVARIDNSGFMGAKLINENRVMSFREFQSGIPGAGELRLASKVVLKSKGDSFEIKPKVGTSQEILINLNWNQKGSQSRGFLSRLMARPIDLDLGCLFELADGRKGGVQALGNAMGSYHQPPFVMHMGDDRTGAMAEGEFLRVNAQHIKDIRRILVFAFIYEGVARWSEADGVVTIKVAGLPDVEVHMDEHRADLGMCAIAILENVGGRFKVSKVVDYFRGHEEMDRAYSWGLRYAAGSK